MGKNQPPKEIRHEEIKRDRRDWRKELEDELNEAKKKKKKRC